MKDVTNQKIAEAMDKHLAKYQELVQKREGFQQRLAKAEAEKGSVKESIFKKVSTEYRSQLDKLAEEIKPVEAEVDKIRGMISDETRKIEDERKKLEDELEELSFRQRVGEFDEAELPNLATPVKERMQALDDHRTRLDAMTRQIDSPPPVEDSTPAEDAIPPSDDVTAAVDSTPEAAPEAPATSAPHADDSQNLVNPSEWMKEFQEDKATKTPARRATDKTPLQEPAPAVQNAGSGTDPLSSLADPTEEAAGKEQPQPSKAGVATKEPPRSFPVLIITKGPGAGKKLPLVPMTMTMGREHDNNIELKDEEVARYHARISYERGNYLLQDLESPSGTWVNDERLSQPTSLKHGDKIRLGSTELMIDFE